METDAARLLELAPRQVSSHALVLIDPAGRIVAWLGGAPRIFGYEPAEIVGQDVARLFVPEDLARGIDRWERETATQAGTSEDDRWQLRRDGARIWVHGALNALRDDTGRVIGFAKLMRERTDQKTQIEALERRLATLERTDAQRVNFVSTLAHELRNPLGTVANAVNILDTIAGAVPEVRFATSMIRRQADFMTRLVSDLLDMARAAVGKVELQKERVVLQALVDESVEACRATIEQRQHQVRRFMPAGPVEVEGDRVRLQQVLVNLIDNAAKYSPPGGYIWIKLTTEGDDAVIHVHDNGAGIAPELMPHIFELFTQGEPARKSHAGLGIGLALVKENITLHGGSVQATSDGAGKGSQFSVRLPLRVPGPARPGDAGKTNLPPVRPPARTSTQTLGGSGDGRA